MFMGGGWVGDEGGMVGLIPRSNRDATDERFSANQQCLTVKVKLDYVFCRIWETKRRQWVWGSFGKPIAGYLGTLQTTFIYIIYTHPQILSSRGVFTTFRSLVLTGPWSIDTAEGQFRDDPDIRQYFKYRVCPFFSLSCLNYFSFDTRKVRRDILNSRRSFFKSKKNGEIMDIIMNK